MPVEQLVQKLCDLKQGYTQFGGLRPFGVSFLFAGHDPHHSFQLYASDPSGNYSGWKATCIGANNSTAQSLLRQDYRDDIGLDEAIGLALKVLSKTMDSTSLDSEKRESGGGHVRIPHRCGAEVLTYLSLVVELATLTVDEETGLPFARIFKPHEIDAGAFCLRGLFLGLRDERVLTKRVCVDSSRARRIGQEAGRRSDPGDPLRRWRLSFRTCSRSPDPHSARAETTNSVHIAFQFVSAFQGFEGSRCLDASETRSAREGALGARASRRRCVHPQSSAVATGMPSWSSGVHRGAAERE